MEGKKIGLIAGGLFIFLIVFGITAVITSSMGYAARKDTTVSLTGITVATNGSLTDFTSTYPFVQTVTSCINASDATHSLTAANYTVITGNSGGSGGFVLADTGAVFVGESVNCTVSYLKTTDATTAAVAMFIIYSTLAGLAVLVFIIIITKPIFKDMM